MSEELIKLFRVQLGTKKYDEMEATWLELLQLNLPFKELIALVDLVQRWAPEKTPPLLWVFADALTEQKRHEDELVVLRRLVELTPDDSKLAAEITACLHKIYPDEPLLEKMLQKSGLGYGKPLSEALDQFDRYIKLAPGRLIFDPQRGPGKVKKLDLLFDRVTVLFQSGEDVVFDIPTASRAFSFPAPDGFFARQEKQPQQLQELAINDPASVIVLLLRDTRQWMSSADIQKHLMPIIGTQNYANLWEKARRALSQHPNIEVQTRANRIYRWTDEPVKEKKTDDVLSSSEKKISSTPRFDYSGLSTMSHDAIIDAYQNLRTATERKRVLKEITLQRTDDWETVYARIFSITPDNTTRTIILEKLKDERPATYQMLVESTLTSYRINIEPFLFLAETDIGPYRPILTRLLDLLETEKNRSLINRVKRILVHNHYQIILKTLAEISEKEAEKLFERIRRVRILEPYQQDEISTIFLKQFPTLKAEPEDNFIWSTVAGIEKAKAELKKLTEEELPRTAEEIARARSFGDLSENYEYKAAKEKQARLMEKINRLRADLSRAKPIEPEKIQSDIVKIGSRVKLQDEEGKNHEFSILGPWDADPENGIISFQSPLAQELIGKKPGDKVKMGDKTLTVTEITSAL
ncbi:transcription elongation factor GreA [candidate division WOR-3 bacterium]|nr:transcription elongation factor GreA [candidate division WOR-3 bacterium]